MAKTKQAPEATPTTEAPKSITRKRHFKKTQEIMHDLLKLEVANAIKNVAWEPNTYSPENVEHVHFYHTVERNGSPQNKCASVNGHFHLLTPIIGDELAYECSPPMHIVIGRNERGAKVKKIVPLNTLDKHTHKVSYIQSEKFIPAKPNAEYGRFAATKAAPPALGTGDDG